MRNIYNATAENKAIVVILPRKNIGHHAKFKAKWKWNGTVNVVVYQPVVCLYIMYAAPIRVYSIIHTIVNTQLGGVSGCFFKFLYQLSRSNALSIMVSWGPLNILARASWFGTWCWDEAYVCCEGWTGLGGYCLIINLYLIGIKLMNNLLLKPTLWNEF